MKLLILIFPILFPFFLGNLYAQDYDLNSFIALKSSGPVPVDFQNSIHKIESDYASRNKHVKKQRKIKGQEKFNVATSYYINEMFLSGNVVFGDPIGKYVNEVADSLLVNFPEIRKQVRFYITKSPVANAYSTDNGVIFINVGLIARVKNEAQLAFIIAHEVVHYYYKHNISIFLEKEKAFDKKEKDNSYRYLSLVEKLLAINYRSKEIEAFADREGLRTYYSSSSYDIGAIKDVFDVLLYSSYPFTNEPFDLSLLETKNMIIPDYYLVDEVDQINPNEDEADSLSTHPNVKKRKEGIQKLIDSIPIHGTKAFLHPESEFKYINALARFEVIRQLIISHELGEALFCTAEVLQEYPDNFYLQKCFAATLYGISAYKTKEETSEIMKYYKDIKGEMRQVNFMVSKLNKRDLNILALNYVWRLHNEHPEDNYLAEISKELFHNLVFDSNIKESFFQTKTLAELKLEQINPEPEDTSSSNRHRKKHTRESKIDSTFTKFAFIDLLSDSLFMADFRLQLRKKDSTDEAENVRNYTYTPFNSGIEKSKTKKRRDRKYIQKIVFADPYIIKLDSRKRDNVKYQESEASMAKVKGLMIENADRAGLQMEMADAIGVGENGSNEFNEMSFVNEYISERFSQSKDGVISSFCTQYIDSLMQKNQTHYLGWMAITSIQKKKNIALLSIFSLVPYLWPYTIYKFIVPRIHSYYYQVLFDVNTGKIVFAKVSCAKSDLRNDQMNSHIYDFMYSIRKTYE
jgi:hypothetical protein